MKKIFYILTILFAFGCSEYNKVLKSTDPEYKYEKAIEYYQDGDCYKAQPLLEELIGITRGTTRSEDVYYNHANVYYCLNQYYMSSYYYKTFVKTFPNSKYTEEAYFLAAMSNYRNSPKYSIDQADTQGAIDAFQLFIDKYPTSELKDSTNKMIEELRAKLEFKAYEIAELYHKTEKYKGAVIALDDFIKKYPSSPNREKAMFLIVDSRFKYAKNSIPSKQRDRFELCMVDYNNFANNYPDSDLLKQAKRIAKQSTKEVETSYFREAKLAFDRGSYGTAFSGFQYYIRRYPSGDMKEKAMFYSVKSSYLLALAQPQEKKLTSFEYCIESYLNFADTFSSSKLLNKAEKFYLESKKKITEKS